MKKITFGILLLISGGIQAQLSIDNTTYTPEQLVKNVLVNNSITPLNVVYNGSAANTIVRDQIGAWNTGVDAGNLGMGANKKGVLLTTGQAKLALGPNDANSNSLLTVMNPVTEGDSDLQKLAGNYPVRNVSVLQFDFVATGTDLNFDYVFASEEYPEFALSSFNDVFGFFISGPGISGGGGFVNDAKNIAQLPTTTTGSNVVSINNVNAVVNSQYYVDNGNGSTPLVNTYTQYDGFTTQLQAMSKLQVGETYHIKFAVGNVSDNAYDSGVFLKNCTVSTAALGVKENRFDSNFSIYPNPSTNMVAISNTTNLTINEVKIIDMNGRIIKSEKFNDMTAVKINISEINSGVYFLEITSNEGKAVKRLIKD